MSFLPPARLLLPWLIATASLLTAGSVAAAEFTLRFEVNGSPAHWEGNTMDYPGVKKLEPEIKIDLGPESVNVAGLYLFTLRRGEQTLFGPGRRTGRDAFTLDADRLKLNLRQAAGLAWSEGRLFVAEPHHDGVEDNNVWIFNGETAQHFFKVAAVPAPRAVAATKEAYFVSGESEMTGIDFKTKKPFFRVPIKDGSTIHALAAGGGRLYAGDSAGSCVRIYDARNGQELGTFSGEGANRLAVKNPATGGLGVATLPGGDLLVSDAVAIRRFTAEGRFVSEFAKIADTQALAVSPSGRVAVTVPRASNFVSDVWVYDANGHPLQRLLRTGWGRTGTFDVAKWNYLGGLQGKVLSPGGVAFDDQDNLYIADFNDYVKGPNEYRGFGDHIASDGGVVKVNAAGDIVARLGGRDDDGALEKARLLERSTRPSLLRSREALQAGKRFHTFVWGDSLTQVGGDWNGGATATAKNWTSVFNDLLGEAYPGLKPKVTASGLGGNLVFDCLTRSAVPDPYPQAELCLLQFGTNDAMFEPPARFAEGLRLLIKQLKVQTDCDIVLLTPHMLEGEKLSQLAAPIDYVKAAQAVGREAGVPVIDMAARMKAKLAGRPWSTLYLDRGAPFDPHPNDAGHRAWAECVLEGLQAELAAEKSSR